MFPQWWTGSFALALVLIVGGGIGPCSVVWAQDIVLLKSANVGPYNLAASAFKQSLPSHIQIQEYDLEGNLELGRKLGRKVRASRARLVVAVGLKATLAAKLEIVDIPIISCMVLAPSKYDLKAANITSIGLQIPLSRQFDLIRHLSSKIKRVGVLYDPAKSENTIEQAQRVANTKGLDLLVRPVSSPEDVPATVRSLLPQIDLLWLIPDSTVLTQDSLEFLLNTTLEARVPILGFSPGLVRSGALAGLYVDYSKLGSEVAALAQQFLNGKSMPQGSILPPQHVSLAINKQIADFLKITIPSTVIAKAAEIF